MNARQRKEKFHALERCYSGVTRREVNVLNRTFTALNHRARRAARRERRLKLPVSERKYEKRPSWQRVDDWGSTSDSANYRVVADNRFKPDHRGEHLP